MEVKLTAKNTITAQSVPQRIRTNVFLIIYNKKLISCKNTIFLLKYQS